MVASLFSGLTWRTSPETRKRVVVAGLLVLGGLHLSVISAVIDRTGGPDAIRQLAPRGSTLVIEPGRVASSINELNPLKATLRDDRGGQIDVTDSAYCRWTSSDPAIAEVSNYVADSEPLPDGQHEHGGVVQFLKKGTVTFTATFGTLADRITLASADRWAPRDSAAAVAFKGQMYLLGGYLRQGARTNDVFRSSDGRTWDAATLHASWRPRSLHAVVEFHDRLWLFGGIANDGRSAYQDVWTSADGVNWSLAMEHAPWRARGGFGYAVFDNKLWVIGGTAYDWNTRTALNDIWNSDDGVRWNLVTDAPAWTARALFDAVVFRNRLWIVGGQGMDGTNCSDIWSSSNGKDWVKEADLAPWLSRRYHRAVVFNGELLMLAGMDAYRTQADVWAADDGRTWRRVAEAPWSPRIQPAVLVFGDALWLMGGSLPGSGSEETVYNDVWRSVDGSTWGRLYDAWAPRDSMGSLVFDSKLFLTGGWFNGTQRANDVFSSEDGTNWTEATPQAPWRPRNLHAALAFADRIWVFGGASNSPSGELSDEADVWNSADGKQWTVVTTKADWAARAAFGKAVFRNRLWVIGGVSHKGEERTYYGDVWSSEDGTHWRLETGSPGWRPRAAFDAVVFRNKLWIVGGQDSSGRNCDDVWSSEDGRSWVREVASTPWQGRHFHRLVVYKDRLYLLAGIDNVDKNCNDVWSSRDGRTWTLVTRQAPWPSRHEPSVLVFQSKIWLFGGLGGHVYRDVWSSENGRDWRLVRRDR
jgi:N-acetylneuraminic acid mutarotase